MSKLRHHTWVLRPFVAVLAVLLLVLVSGCGGNVVTSTDTSSKAIKYTPVTLKNCDLTITYKQPPQRAVTMTQSATEVMLALGLEKHMVGTAYLDNPILPEYQQAYSQIRVLAPKYPSREVFLGVEPDFVFSTEESAFAKEVLGSREELLKLGIYSYLLPIECDRPELRPERVTMENLYQEIREIGRIFGVEERADKLIAQLQVQLQETQQKLGKVTTKKRIFWYDSEDPPLTVSNWGMPNHMIELAGGENIFKDIQKKEAWVTVNWEDVIARQPDVIVLIDANWSSAEEKRRILKSNPAYSQLKAVQQDKFIVLGFSYTMPGIRNIAGVRQLAEALYPERFK
ncbi:ABC transporter substrate-binding protein [Fischerella thermalis CCMEE 5268]|uniref:ABC transporter substrate-binding protein n=1 Tax=Fischerella thermalis CCMEE 5268 TaxID=2019662 RepID=A0A2N6KA67_9CYAN|nr:ABC transporter substrate-binding protein [Fischerella thermalis]PLZ95019.1 ABC transporter substrate-binding protein [Fischerella thermalis CCMEE 5268]